MVFCLNRMWTITPIGMVNQSQLLRLMRKPKLFAMFDKIGESK